MAINRVQLIKRISAPIILFVVMYVLGFWCMLLAGLCLIIFFHARYELIIPMLLIDMVFGRSGLYMLPIPFICTLSILILIIVTHFVLQWVHVYE